MAPGICPQKYEKEMLKAFSLMSKLSYNYKKTLLLGKRKHSVAIQYGTIYCPPHFFCQRNFQKVL